MTTLIQSYCYNSNTSPTGETQPYAAEGGSQTQTKTLEMKVGGCKFFNISHLQSNYPSPWGQWALPRHITRWETIRRGSPVKT